MDVSLPGRFAPRGLAVGPLGFGLIRFPVTLAAYEGPVRFAVAGVVPLVLGLGLAAFGVALAVGDFDRSYVAAATRWSPRARWRCPCSSFYPSAGNGTSLATVYRTGNSLTG